MTFITRFNLPNKEPPVRAYLHQAGFKELYGGDTDKAEFYFLGILDSQHKNLDNFGYVLATIWGDKDSRAKIIDFFGYSSVSPKENPEVHAWVVRDGVTIRTGLDHSPTTCGDTLIVLGREEEHRRTTKDLNDFMSNPPPLEEVLKGLLGAVL
jgi:hypothetical protein